MKQSVKRSQAVVIAGAFGGFLLTQPNVPAVRAQSADLVLCDRIAADPADPDKPADVKGVSEIAPSDVATAIKFCKRASANSTSTLRFRFQTRLRPTTECVTSRPAPR